MGRPGCFTSEPVCPVPDYLFIGISNKRYTYTIQKNNKKGCSFKISNILNVYEPRVRLQILFYRSDCYQNFIIHLYTKIINIL